MSDLPQLHRINQMPDKKCFLCEQDLEESEYHNYYFVNFEYELSHMRCWRIYMKQNKHGITAVRCTTCGILLEIDEQQVVWSSYRAEKNKCWVCGGYVERVVE